MVTSCAIVSIVLMILAAYIVVMNWAWIIASERNRRKGIRERYSTVPLVSLIVAGVFAYPLYPFAPKGWIFIIPALDIGNWNLFGLFVGPFRREPPEIHNEDDK